MCVMVPVRLQGKRTSKITGADAVNYCTGVQEYNTGTDSIWSGAHQGGKQQLEDAIEVMNTDN
jgi:hypothetical protein